MAELKLRNCPFCGGKAEKRTYINSAGFYVYHVYCPQCQIGTMKHTWILCSERLPESEREVLVYVKGDFDNSIPFITTAYINSDHDWQSDYDGEVIDSKITHWMPLPEPPKE